jgi:hypothetical protein
VVRHGGPSSDALPIRDVSFTLFPPAFDTQEPVSTARASLSDRPAAVSWKP